jgi:predicted XRE-type DNA-binding protein
MEDYIVSSGNIFKDIGYANAEEKFTKTKLAAIINKIIKERRFTYEEVARILDINQSKIYALENGRLKSFSMECLFSFLEALDQHIEITVTAKSKVNTEQNITVAYL